MAENLGPVRSGQQTFRIKDLDGDGRPERLDVTVKKVPGTPMDATNPTGLRVVKWALRLSSGEELSALGAIQNSSRRFVERREAYRYQGIPEQERGFHYFISELSVRTLHPGEGPTSVRFLAHPGEEPMIGVSCRPGSTLRMNVSPDGQTNDGSTVVIDCKEGGVLSLPKHEQPTIWEVGLVAMTPGSTPYAMHYRHYHDERVADAFNGRVTAFQDNVTVFGGRLLFSVEAQFDHSPFPASEAQRTLDIDHLF